MKAINFHTVGNSAADSAGREIHVTHISTKREIQILDRNGGRGAVVEVMLSCLIL